jgi:hypothetical protein
MGCPVSSIKQFENELTHYCKNWAVVVFANAHSDSRAVEFVIRNFHIMDRISDNINFYMPGYYMSWDRSEFIQPDEWMNNELNEIHKDFHYSKDRGGNFPSDSFFSHNQHNIDRNKGYGVIESPRLGSIFFSDADYADFVMEFTSKKFGYFYSGACELILLPIVQGKADYLASRVYDLDAIVECQCGNSLDQFLHRLFQIMREGNPLNGIGLWNRIFNMGTDVIRVAEKLYRESISSRFIEEKYEIVIQNVVLDIEKCVHWSLSEEFYFISYSTRNTMLAENLKLEMQDKGKNVWIAPDGIPQGREYSLVIPTTLKFVKTFVLLLTPDSAKSHWVKRELDIAISNGSGTKVKVILAEGYSIEDIRNDNELYFYLNRVQVRYNYNDIINNQENFSRFLDE